MHVRVYVYTYTRVCTCIRIYVYSSIRILWYIRIYICTFICICVWCLCQHAVHTSLAVSTQWTESAWSSAGLCIVLVGAQTGTFATREPGLYQQVLCRDPRYHEHHVPGLRTNLKKVVRLEIDVDVVVYVLAR